ncbi:hypothetical protein AHAS_Ahas17G0210600 [Arachis hypogaea]
MLGKVSIRLVDFAQLEVTKEMLDERVHEYVIDGNWHFDRIVTLLGEDWYPIFASIKLLKPELGTDCLAWFPVANGTIDE